MSYVPGAVGLEERLLEDVGVDEGWALLERFSTLVRESGSADEHAAAEYIAARLAAMGVEHEVYEPDLYLSLPRESWVEAGGERLEAKPPSFAVPTPGSGIEAELVHVPSTAVTGQRDLFERHVRELPDVRGKIVLTEGYAMPASVAL
ncbi:MAG: peptidase M28, partial [Gemmatimonadota bacterium]|nr:peptidase M28 [Gemmatimonadota bacterium]